jgi:hypothetical protein
LDDDALLEDALDEARFAADSEDAFFPGATFPGCALFFPPAARLRREG